MFIFEGEFNLVLAISFKFINEQMSSMMIVSVNCYITSNFIHAYFKQVSISTKIIDGF